jgi:hypothetical protein
MHAPLLWLISYNCTLEYAEKTVISSNKREEFYGIGLTNFSFCLEVFIAELIEGNFA